METTSATALPAKPAALGEAMDTAATAFAPAARKERLFYIDNLRLLMIIFVVIQHAAVTYTGLGNWYYHENSHPDILMFLTLGLWEAVSQAYFMGILFLVAGYFVPGAYDKKGFWRFLKDRFIRLGIPAMLYMLVINPFIGYYLLDVSAGASRPAPLEAYAGYITRLDFLSGSGPLWFVLALLVFSLVYGMVRLAANRLPRKSPVALNVTDKGLYALFLVIAVFAFLLRIYWPAGVAVLNMQLGNFSQYIILFFLGTLAYRQNWLSKLDTGLGMRWLHNVRGLIPGLLGAIMLVGGGFNRGMDAFFGGLHWQSAAYALWESFTAVSLSVGLLVLFRERFNHQSQLVKILSDNSFAVYVFHAPVLIAISLLLRPVALYPLIKFAIVAPLAISASFALTYLFLRRVPLLKQVI